MDFFETLGLVAVYALTTSAGLVAGLTVAYTVVQEVRYRKIRKVMEYVGG